MTKTKTRKREKIGDILEVEVDGGFGYLHYLGKHARYGGCVLVRPGVHSRQDTFPASFFADAYVTFYPVGAALWHGLVSIVVNLKAPEIPDTYRRPCSVQGRQILTWFIDRPTGTILVVELSDSDLQIPIAGLWNHSYLVHRIAVGWTPLMEGNACKTEETPEVEEVADNSDLNPEREITHYLYIPKKTDAHRVGEELKAQGYDVEVRLRADGVNCLVLTKHISVPTDDVMAALRRSIEAPVEAVAGEYDGWEVALSNNA